MLERVLETEQMDTDRDAREYDAMDHAAVNAQFVADLFDALNSLADWSLKRPVQSAESPALEILDLGTGTAQLAIELCRRAPGIRVVAIDAAESMLNVSRENVAAAQLIDRIELVLADAKRLPFEPGRFSVVISNSIVHHVAEPRALIEAAIRVTAPGGLLFHRDLARPSDEEELARIVARYAVDATSYQRTLFADSLRAALTIAEMQQLVAEFGFASETVAMTSDRHWTWTALYRE
jgi:ubiquinone/menaquinone biosynthesis C-methylase UbiE